MIPALALAVLAQEPAPGFSLARMRAAADARVLYGSPAEAGGVLWARAATYKASFESGTATYVPFLGSQAPRNFPVAFRLDRVAVGGQDIAFDAAARPARTADTVSFDRGSIVELYDLAPEGLEQRFVLDGLPPGGDLVLRIAVESEVGGLSALDGIRFSNEHGSVLYGLATAIDARGKSVPAPTDFTAGAIEIRVPESFLADAAYPLTIDPWISNFPVSALSFREFHPDVAFDADSNRFLVVYEREFSASDHDVHAHVLSSTGAVLDTSVIDTGISENWAAPAVANVDNNNMWLVVAQVGASGSRRIRGHTVSPQTFAVGNDIAISPSGLGDCTDADVGGDPTLASGRHFCVVWETEADTDEENILARLVGPDGTVEPTTILLEGTNGASNRRPRISKHKGNGTGSWNIVWDRSSAVWGARIHENGTVSNPAIQIVPPSASSAVASSPRADGTWLLAYRVTGSTTGPDIRGRLMSGLATLHDVDLSALIGGGFEARSQEFPAVDADDNGFVLTYTEKYTAASGTNYDVVGATITPVGGRLHVSEGHVLLGQSAEAETGSRVCTRDSSGNQSVPGRAVVVWQLNDGTDVEVEGAVYELEDFTSFCFPGASGVLACPCGNPGLPDRGCDNSSGTGGALLSATGTASLAADTAVLHTAGERPSATSIVAQFSAPSVAGLQFGQGVRCAAGTLKRLYTKAASFGQITAPSGADPSLSARSAALGDVLAAGTTRYYLVYYRDPNILGGCAPSAFFNTTQGGAITWRP